MSIEWREGMLLSDAILIACRDARSALETGYYELDGGLWHSDRGEKCSICLAGGVIAGLCSFDGEEHDPDEFPIWAANLFCSLDYVRLGKVSAALRGTNSAAISYAEGIAVDRADALILSRYDDDTALAPLEIYEQAAQILAEVGL